MTIRLGACGGRGPRDAAQSLEQVRTFLLTPGLLCEPESLTGPLTQGSFNGPHLPPDCRSLESSTGRRGLPIFFSPGHPDGWLGARWAPTHEEVREGKKEKTESPYLHPSPLSEPDKDAGSRLTCPKGTNQRGLKGRMGAQTFLICRFSYPPILASHSVPTHPPLGVRALTHLHMRQNRFLQTRQ